MRVTMKQSEYERILQHSRDQYPEEACGLIAGIDREDGVREIRAVYLLTNTDHSGGHFSIDPIEQLAAVRAMRASGLKPLGNWHSHPETPSRSSEEDIRFAVDKNASYLILSLQDPEAPVLNSFHVEQGISTAEELTIIEDLETK